MTTADSKFFKRSKQHPHPSNILQHELNMNDKTGLEVLQPRNVPEPLPVPINFYTS